MNKIDEIKYYQTRFETSRRSLLMLIILTAINLVFVMIQFDIYFLFSALIPLYALYIGKALTEGYGLALYNILGYVLSVVILLLYVVSWYFSQKRRGFILLAFGLFLLDCFVLSYLLITYGFDYQEIPNLLFHCYILFILSTNVVDWYRLRKVDPEDEIRTSTYEAAPLTPLTTTVNPDEETRAFEVRDDVNKGRTVIFAEYDGLQISIKRSQKRTELIIDGQVYDEYYGLFEGNYNLSANVNNHLIEGRCNAISGMMYIYVDGALIKKKLRLY